MTKNGSKRLQRGLLRATCLSAIIAASPALASTPTAQAQAQVVARNAPAGATSADTGVNGIGQIVARNGASLNLCTGTLINPRTVLFAAHCVNHVPAASYGQQAGSTPVAIGFAADNQAAVRQWLGLDGGLSAGLLQRTNQAQSLYAVEQIWYDPRSLGGASGGFMAADIALATLDTPAFDVPTWAMLFSPLDGPAPATITGYGHAALAAGGAAQPALDWRRRTAENMISVLGSMNDRDRALFGTSSAATNNLYMLSFSDPEPGYDPAAGKFDFGLFGDRALPREGAAVGGDSGGPLIVDRTYDRAVVAGVLSGVARFFPDQRLQDYGTQSFYQPLHLYWDVIAANNSYIYAGNRTGDGDWEDPNHWVKRLDPNYMIAVDGKLVNALPATPAQGIAPGGAKFGQVCFLASCTSLASEAGPADILAASAQGGTDTLASAPDNVTARPRDGVQARYYDVTLSAPGATRLSSAVTIDRFTLDGFAQLDVRADGALRVLGEYNQLRGWTHVDGALASERDMLVASGLLSGSGALRAPFLTVAGAAVAPGGVGRIGTLAVQGHVILSSASQLVIDAARGDSDRLAVDGILSLSSGAADGGTILIRPAADRPAPRHGDSLVVATATQGVQGTFETLLHGFRGVLRPELRYDSDAVTAYFRAASLADFLTEKGATELAFATALDRLRDGSGNRLAQLYGTVDLMDADALGRTLRGLAPTPAANEALFLEREQSRELRGAITDRLAVLGTGAPAGRMDIVGTPQALIGISGGRQPEHLFLANLGSSAGVAGKAHTLDALPGHLSGFISGGVSRRESWSGGDRGPGAGQRSWHFGMGLETAIADQLTLGTAFGYSDGSSTPGEGRAEVHARMSQVALYASHRLSDTGYVGGMVSAERSRGGIARQAQIGESTAYLQGDTSSRRINTLLETGVGVELAHGLTVTPRAQIGYERYHLSDLRERGSDIALTVDDLLLERLDAKLGATLTGSASLRGGWAFSSQLRLDGIKRLAGEGDHLRVRFLNAADVPIALPLAAGQGSGVEMGGRLSLARGDVEFGVGGTMSFGRLGLRDDRAAANLVLRF